MKEAFCKNEDCKKKFSSSTYWFMMKRTDFPELCGDCRRKRRDKMRKEQEE
jgi:hypothetical protein